MSVIHRTRRRFFGCDGKKALAIWTLHIDYVKLEAAGSSLVGANASAHYDGDSDKLLEVAPTGSGRFLEDDSLDDS